MEVYRLPPYPIVTTWDVPLPSTSYTISVEDLIDHSIQTTTATSNSSSKITYTLPRSKVEYDRKFLFTVKDSSAEIVVYSNLDVLRPYIDPSSLGTTATEIQEYKILELVARSMIDTVITDGFYNNKHIVQGVGTGSDYFPIWEDLNKVLKVYENNVLVYDNENPEDYEYDYGVTLDNSAIQRVVSNSYNRSESKPLTLAPGIGDLGFFGNAGVAFPLGYDYTMIIDAGYKAVPADVEYATKLLIEDLKCGKLDYYKRYATSYSTDQFRIQFEISIEITI
jgi:hypothetical protein